MFLVGLIFLLFILQSTQVNRIRLNRKISSVVVDPRPLEMLVHSVGESRDTIILRNPFKLFIILLP